MSVEKETKNSKAIYIIIAAILVIGVVALIFIKPEEKLSEEEAIRIIENEFELLLGYDEEMNNPFVKEVYEGFEVTINRIKADKEGYVVSCTFSNYDLNQSIESMDENDEMTLKEYTEMFVNNLQEQQRVTYKTELYITASQNVYTTSFNQEQLDAATGGLISCYEKIFEEVTK